MDNLMKKINEVDNKLDLILDLVLKQSSALTTYNEVSQYLNKSTRTIRNYIINGKLVQNVHYNKDNNGKTIFIAKAIIAFKENSNEPKTSMNKETKVTSPRIIHPTASRILQGIAS